ncbi:hypothetical protein EAF04_007790 [Stromatinia cepivora]|nr:hypothetical protein EAF04_007790 [Stromatinia cepivora]
MIVASGAHGFAPHYNRDTPYNWDYDPRVFQSGLRHDGFDPSYGMHNFNGNSAYPNYTTPNHHVNGHQAGFLGNGQNGRSFDGTPTSRHDIPNQHLSYDYGTPMHNYGGSSDYPSHHNNFQGHTHHSCNSMNRGNMNSHMSQPRLSIHHLYGSRPIQDNFVYVNNHTGPRAGFND